MRDYTNILELRPTMIGSLSVVGATAVGAPVDTIGFADVLATLTAGALLGSGTGATLTVAVKIQESASASGTGALWTDIADGAINGTFAFSTLTFSNTDPALKMETKYEHLKDGLRKRYIRAHATVGGTNGMGPKVCVNFLLGRPNDTLYVAKGTSFATGNPEFTLLR